MQAFKSIPLPQTTRTTAIQALRENQWHKSNRFFVTRDLHYNPHDHKAKLICRFCTMGVVATIHTLIQKGFNPEQLIKDPSKPVHQLIQEKEQVAHTSYCTAAIDHALQSLKLRMGDSPTATAIHIISDGRHNQEYPFHPSLKPIPGITNLHQLAKAIYPDWDGQPTPFPVMAEIIEQHTHPAPDNQFPIPKPKPQPKTPTTNPFAPIQPFMEEEAYLQIQRQLDRIRIQAQYEYLPL